MKYCYIILLLLTTNVYAHGSSHYSCKSERIGDDRIEHCNYYDHQYPDKIYVDYYTEEKFQERQEHQQFMMWYLIISCGIISSFVVLFLISLSRPDSDSESE